MKINYAMFNCVFHASQWNCFYVLTETVSLLSRRDQGREMKAFTLIVKVIIQTMVSYSERELN